MEMKIKSWIIDKEQDTAGRYNTYFDFTRRGIHGQIIEEDNCYYVSVQEVLRETEKAMQIKIHTGSVVGSYKGWTMWVPKSQIMA